MTDNDELKRIHKRLDKVESGELNELKQIDQRLRSIEHSLAKICEIGKHVEEHHTILTGGMKPNQGLIVIVDRLKQADEKRSGIVLTVDRLVRAEDSRVWQLRTLWGGVIMMAGAAAAAIIASWF